MKKIILALIFITSFSCKAQNPVLPLYKSEFAAINGAYYKDMDDFHNQFVGTWVLNNGTTYLKVTRFDSSKKCNFIPGHKKHGGVDIFLPPTSAIYSMHPGVVINKYDDLTPSQYVEQSLGNWIEIQSIVNGETVKIKYCHLATIELPVGATIAQGNLIAISGRNGNAGQKGVTPHLHIQAKKKIGNTWVEMDPISLFDTIFDSNTLQPTGSKSNCQ
jgi:murein DD-endopeptidase MepM/ murein hydrolase activator NlpD